MYRSKAFIIIIIQTSGTLTSGENKILYELHLQSHKYQRRGKQEETLPGEQPTVDCALKPVQRFSGKHTVGKVIPHTNLAKQETPCKLGCSSPCHLEL